MATRPDLNTGRRLGLVLATLVLSGTVQAQLGQCVGQVETTEIEGFGTPENIAVNNHRLVTSDGPTVSNWRLGDPSSPEFLGRWNKWDERFLSLHRIEIDDRGFAFAGYGYGNDPPWFSIRIWDLREGQEPRPASVLTGSWIDFFVDGNLLVGVNVGGSDLVIVDVSDPFAPEVLCTNCGGISLDNSPPSYGQTNIRIENVGGNAVVLDFNELLVIDYTNPISPTVGTTVGLDPPVVGTGTRLWANETMAVAAPNSSGEVVIVDLENIGTPTVNTYEFEIGALTWGTFHDDVLIASAVLTAQARRLDLSDPAAPAELPPIILDFWPDSGAVWNDRLYLAGDHVIRIYGLQGVPSEVGSGPYDRYADRVAIAGEVGLATGRRNLLTYDLSDPNGPTEASSLELDWWPQLPATDGVMGAVFSYGGGIVLVDLSTPGETVFLDTVPLRGTYATDIEIDTGRLIVASQENGTAGWLELWEVSLTAPPVFLSQIELAEPIWQVETIGSRVFLGLDGAVVEVDITDPSNPVVGAPIDLQHLASDITGLAAMGNELFAVDGYSVAVLEITIPGAAVERTVVNYSLGGAGWLLTEGSVVVSGLNGGKIHVMGTPDGAGLIPMVDVDPPPGWSLRGGISGGKLYLARRFNLTTIDVSCTPLMPDFTWYSMGRQVRFVDRTTFDDWGDDREWVWSISGDLRVFSSRSPLIHFEEYGSYEVTMALTTETGTVEVTKTVDVGPQPNGSLIFTDGFEFRNAEAWSNSTP